MAGTNGKQKTARDMILSLGVIVLAAGFIYLFIPHDDSAPDLKRGRLPRRTAHGTPRRVATRWPRPRVCPTPGRPTSVRFKGDDFDAWHLGFHDPEGEYVAVEQSTQQRPVFLEEATQGAPGDREDREDRRPDLDPLQGGRYDALVLEGTKGSTTVVTGTASFAQLTKMAQALKTE